jgi:hypothetical protein
MIHDQLWNPDLSSNNVWHTTWCTKWAGFALWGLLRWFLRTRQAQTSIKMRTNTIFTKIYPPTVQFAGSLGKLTVSSVNNPRKMIDTVVSSRTDDEVRTTHTTISPDSCVSWVLPFYLLLFFSDACSPFLIMLCYYYIAFVSLLQMLLSVVWSILPALIWRQDNINNFQELVCSFFLGSVIYLRNNLNVHL